MMTESSFVLAFNPTTLGPKETKILVCQTPIRFRPEVLIVRTMQPCEIDRVLVHDIFVEHERDEDPKRRSGRQTSYVIKASSKAVLPASLFAQGREFRLAAMLPDARIAIVIENDGPLYVNLVASYLGMGACEHGC